VNEKTHTRNYQQPKGGKLVDLESERYAQLAGTDKIKIIKDRVAYNTCTGGNGTSTNNIIQVKERVNADKEGTKNNATADHTYQSFGQMFAAQTIDQKSEEWQKWNE
jgi:hypothetical protein